MNHLQLFPPSSKPPLTAQLLHHFYQGGTLNKFEAINLFRHRNLANVISKLKTEYSLNFSYQSERTICPNNMETICPRYWLINSIENIDAANYVLVNEFGYIQIHKPAA